jgi:hypothetical protein
LGKNELTKLLVVALLIIGLGSLYTARSNAGTITDNFDGATVNTRLWTPFQNPKTECGQQGGELWIKIGAGSDEGAGVNSKFRVKGDYEMTVDYRLIIWPPVNDVRLGFEGPGFSADDFAEFMIKRISRSLNDPPTPGKEVYSAAFKEGSTWWGNDVLTTDDHGSLKLTRIGSVLTGYFSKDGSPWQVIGSHNYSTPPGLPEWGAVMLWANGTPTTDVEIAFSNFRVTYDQIKYLSAAPAPLSLLMLD